MRQMFTIMMLVSPLALMGCGDDGVTLARGRQVDTYNQAPAVEADVLFVVDNSSSMRSSQEKLQSAFQSFTDGLEAIESDFHIAVTTTDVSDEGAQGAMIRVIDPETGLPSPYISSTMDDKEGLFEGAVLEVGTSGDVFEAGLEAAALALLPEARGGVGDTVNEGFLRESAKLAVVWISDEDDCSHDGTLPMINPDECYDGSQSASLVPVPEFVQDYLSLKWRDEDVVLGAIVGVDPRAERCGDVAVAKGDRYMDAVELVGGVVGDICTSDFDNIMEELGVNAAGQRTVFALSRVPDPESIEVYVGADEDSATLRDSGWTYLEEPNAISFFGEAIPPRDSVIQISYVVVAN